MCLPPTTIQLQIFADEWQITAAHTSAPSPKSLGLRCVQNGSSARREEGAYLDRYVTDEQRSSRPIFNATLRAAASWLFFLRRGGSTVMTQIAALRSRLEKQPTDLRRNPRDLGDGARAVGRDFRGLPYAEAHGRPPDRSDEFDAG